MKEFRFVPTARWMVMLAILLILTFLAVPVAITQAKPKATMIHQWTFNTNGNDSIGTANATLAGTAYIGGCQVNFDGAQNTYATLPIGADIATLTDSSFEAWVTLKTNVTWARVFDFGYPSGGTGTYMFLTTKNGRLDAGPVVGTPRFATTVNTNVSGEDQATSATALATGTQYHMVVTIDHTNSLGTLYVNGVQVAQNTRWLKNLTPSSLGNTTGNYLGNSNFALDPSLNGSINEFRIYNGVLSSAEVLSNYNTGLPSCATTTTVVSSLNPSIVGQSVTFTATVATIGKGSPPSTVAFKSDSVVITGCNAQAVDANGVATCTTSALAAGNHTISADYSGNTIYAASSGNMTGNPQVVVDLRQNSITSSLNPSNFGQNVTFTATFNICQAPDAPARKPRNGGTISFYDGATLLATVPDSVLDLCSVQASFSSATLATGTHHIFAAYSGNEARVALDQVVNGPRDVPEGDTLLLLGGGMSGLGVWLRYQWSKRRAKR